MNRSSGPARRSAAPAGAEEPLPPTPRQASQPTAEAGLLAILQATNATGRGIAIQQSPQLIPLRRIGRVLGHHRPYGRHRVRRPPAWRLGASGGRRIPGIRAGPIGARDGAGRPAAVLPLGSQHRQYCRNPLEVLRPRTTTWSGLAELSARRPVVEGEPCPTAARRRATTERATLKRRLGRNRDGIIQVGGKLASGVSTRRLRFTGNGEPSAT
jgi:hypothetical protein